MFLFENPGHASTDVTDNIVWLERVTRDFEDPRELSTTTHNLLTITHQLERVLIQVAEGLTRHEQIAHSATTAPADIGLTDSRAAVEGLRCAATELRDVEHHLNAANTRAAGLAWYPTPDNPDPSAHVSGEALATRVGAPRRRTRDVRPGRSL